MFTGRSVASSWLKSSECFSGKPQHPMPVTGVDVTVIQSDGTLADPVTRLLVCAGC